MIGRTLSHYTIESPLGKGGMGEVYSARDSRLGRSVALKILPGTAHVDDALRRFMTEARAASALNHPNIVTIHDIDDHEGVHFIVMEKIEGTSLAPLIGPPIPIDEFLDIALQMTGALGAAHEAGIVHRDIKPGNVMITRSGLVKIVDFGLARLQPLSAVTSEAETVTRNEQGTRPGMVLGTIGYMAPEQLEGLTADSRSDVFSLGVVFHALLAGKEPFLGSTPLVTITNVLRDDPPPLDSFRSDVPAEITTLVARCLSKDPQSRPADAGEVRKILVAVREKKTLQIEGGRTVSKPIIVAAIIALIIATVVAGFYIRNTNRVRWARNDAPNEVERLLNAEDHVGALRVARSAIRIAPDDVHVQQAWSNLTVPFALRTEPAGSLVETRSYKKDGDWISLGHTPLLTVRIPFAVTRLRITHPGYVTSEIAPTFDSIDGLFTLYRPEETPAGMTPVAGGPAKFLGTTVTVPDFWIDRFEVTNAEYKKFVDAGGYRRPDLWKPPFIQDGRQLAFAEAMTLMIDRTGRPGPSAWELGSYPEGKGDHPVEGISWYEASAYARFVGKTLPTVFHWMRAAGVDGLFADILSLSNFDGKGTVPVGSLRGLGPWGTYDTAGNIEEWCMNAAGDKHYLLGGGWRDPSYQYVEPDARAPMSREEAIGVRLMRQKEAIAAAHLAPILPPARPSTESVDAATYELYARLYDYDQRPLEARIEQVDDAHSAWRKERVSFSAPYGDERMDAYLFIPRNARLPYQAVLVFPGSDAVVTKSSRQLLIRMVEFFIRSGRVVVYPIFKGTYERQVPTPRGLVERRDLRIQRVKDARRTMDYLMTRPDIDRDRIAFYGLSLGASNGPFVLATEPRFRTAVLFASGLTSIDALPEVRLPNFLPRVKVPVLYLTGRSDFSFPYETSQLPYFALLGSEHKKHFVFDGGHIPANFNETVKEMLNWTDRWMGPVVSR